MMENDIANRRPIKSRQQGWAAKSAYLLKNMGVKPNQISIMSSVCALIAGACLLATRYADTQCAYIVLFIVAALFVQGRLLCNLFDGMVAIEGGLKSKSGEIYNDFPDRISDSFILIGAGYAVLCVNFGPVLGWSAAIIAILTAYVRILGVSAGTKQYFSGPMAKQHRMAIITVACLASIFDNRGIVIAIALGVIILGGLITVVRRLKKIIHDLETND